ncbi:MAG: DNA polymerase III subunit delta [Bacteroidales bacterium]
MRFQDIIGQEEVKQKLIRLVREDRPPHALLLHGPPGTGKLALAVAFLQYLSCGNRQERDSCGTCPSCVKFAKLVHPDLHFVVPVTTTEAVKKDPVSKDFAAPWREAFLADPYLSETQWYEAIGAENKQGIINKDESLEIVRKLSFKPYESDYRMLVMWLPEKMHPVAANKLLKFIEEPPSGTHLVLVSEQTDRILPTILSRNQLMHVPPLPAAVIREALLERGESDSRLLEDAVRRSNGNMNLALQTLKKDEMELEHFQRFTSFMRLCYARSIIELSAWVDQVAVIGRERQKQLLDYSLRLLRENFILRMGHGELNFMSSQEEEFSRKFSAFVHLGNVDLLVEEFQEAANHIEANGNPRLVLFDLSIKVIQALMRKEEEAV